MFPKKLIVIGLSGVTCGGKSTLTKRLHKELKNSVTINQDDYFLPIDDPRHIKIVELDQLNFEVITSIDMDKMQSDVLKLIESLPNKSNFAETNEKNVLILDGFLLFKCKVISDLCDRKYFLTLNKEECQKRRVERIYDPPDGPGYFEKAVWPEYLKHMDELMKDKDLYKTITFIDGSRNKEEIYQMVFAEIKKLLS
ncbi:nicotinamide riboside kinase 1 [Hylaeus anthracinus]|uniref:nicotinamide riboside kinase 1 n=1 Tax=Hylaeus anthracinus TaxID=313031 RepID=UPI0023B9E393|nr:nicotinamide riboside kinase 1 [Hylaeus anthracinus]